MLWAKLTPRQREICELLCRGIGPHQIAARLHVENHTVRTHLRRCYERAGIGDDATKTKHVLLAVMLTYERHPELIPRLGLRAETEHNISSDTPIIGKLDGRVRNHQSARVDQHPVFYWRYDANSNSDDTNDHANANAHANANPNEVIL